MHLEDTLPACILRGVGHLELVTLEWKNRLNTTYFIVVLHPSGKSREEKKKKKRKLGRLEGLRKETPEEIPRM